MHRIYPEQDWQRITPAQAGFAAGQLELAAKWLDVQAPNGYRLVVVRHGYVVFERNSGLPADAHVSIASAAKSVYGNVLGAMIEKGLLPSADTRVADIYPEMMDVPPGTGPKEGRYAYEKDRDITFRQLICNVSGYMKPGEEPGKVFNYQTYGMNVLTHALAKLCGLYTVDAPETLPGFAELIRNYIADNIGTHWTYNYANFDLHSAAKLGIYGYYTNICTNALDLARLGWLWCNYGWWNGRSIVPELWMRKQVQVAPDIKAKCPEDEWLYGHGIWTNAAGKLWPELPRDGFTASGAGGHYVSVFPSLALVIVQNPGAYHKQSGSARGNLPVLEAVINAIRN